MGISDAYDSHIKGWGASVELGQSHSMANNATFGYYGGLRYSKLKMDGYTETNAIFPFTFSDVDSNATAAYLGVNYGRTLNKKWAWSTNAEVEQDISHNNPAVQAHANYIGAFNFDGNLAHTRGSLSATLSYALSDAVNLGVTPYVARMATHDTAFGAVLKVAGKF